MSEVSVYVHFPFCVRRCFYCDFVSTTELELIEDYIGSLTEDIERSGYLIGKTVRTVYFGGGTPSTVPVRFLKTVLETLRKNSGSWEVSEFTIECNPESVTLDEIRSYRDMGVNRISLGVQAFDDDVLKRSGRIHDTRTVLRALEIVRRFFDNVNLDFVVGLPGYDPSVVESNLKLVESFRPEHVSVYALELDEGTPLWRMIENGSIDIPNEDELESMLSDMYEGLLDLGYRRYEISNFSLEGKESLHNMVYWKNHDYTGFGVSAGGHIGRFRYVRTLDLREYLENPLSNSYERQNDVLTEFKETLFMGLRLTDGLDLAELEDRFGKDMVESFSCHVKEDELFEIGRGRLKLTEKGLDLSKIALEKVVNWDGVRCQISE